MKNLCKCGCGTEVKKEYALGHHWKVQRDALTPPNPSGFCQCGCGGRAPIARVTSRTAGHVKDHPIQFIYGHHCGPPIEPPNPSGLCMCGCGKTTPIARQSDRHNGNVKGLPIKYIHNHHTQKDWRYYAEENHGYKTPCWIWQRYKDENGYGKLTVGTKETGYKSIGAHRHYYQKAKGPIPEGYQVDHLCFMPSCVNPDHLEAVPLQVNMWRRRFITLTPDKIPTIIQLRKWGATYKLIGRLFGVKGITIYQICKGRSWSDLEHAPLF